MVVLEEKKLLRTLSFTTSNYSNLVASFLLCSIAGISIAEDADPQKEVVEYAPGSTGVIDAPLATIVGDAERRGEALKEVLQPQSAQEGAFSDIEFGDIRDRALSDPRVRSLLGLNGDTAGTAGEEEIRYDGSSVFLLASFSMPQASLRQMMEEAKRFGVPIVFRGFVNNSVYDTQAALTATFGSLDDAVGTSIDPTIFTRFGVESVPHVIATDQTLEVCETSGCEDDPVPAHDRVGGNVPLEFALQLIADQGDVAADVARDLLEGN